MHHRASRLHAVVAAMLLALGATRTAAGVASLTSSTSLGHTEAANIGLTVLARGEFALILASYAAAAGLDERIAPFVAGSVLILALGAPIAAKYAPWLATRVSRGRSSGPPAPGGAPLPHP